jgi:SNF2 family DNA or RNA helicase
MEEDMLTFINGEAHKISNSLGKLIRLQQITLSPKILDSEYKGKGIKTKALLDLLEDTDKKVVVFSWFKTYIEILDEELQKAGYKTAVVTGGKSSEERGKAEKDFWEDPEVKVFLGTIGSAGEGMNLQVADTLIFMDKSWTPAQNRQAEDRIHRVGQKGNATIISFVAKNTIDVDKEITLANKEQVISKVMSMENTAKNLLARTAGNM